MSRTLKDVNLDRLCSGKVSQLADLLPRMPAVLDVLRSVRAGQLVHVSG